MLLELRRAGAEVVEQRGDVAQPADVALMLADIDARMPSLRGIIHAAGVLDDGVLLQQTPERLRAVMAPKMAGAWNLHELTERELDFFVMFSSSASVFGSPGQGNYAAANAFLDALAHFRRRLGQPALSINWGPWGESGMAAGVAKRNERRWAARGIGTIAPDHGVQALQHLLQQDATAQAVVMPIQWARLKEQFDLFGVPPLFQEIARDAPSAPEDLRKNQPHSRLLQALEQAPAGERDRLIATFVQSEVANVMGFATDQSPEPDAGFFQMGMDSLMAVELKNRLQSGLACTLPSTIVFEYPSVRALSSYLTGHSIPREPKPTVLQQAELDAATADLVAEVQQLSDERMVAYIAEQLDALST